MCFLCAVERLRFHSSRMSHPQTAASWASSTGGISSKPVQIAHVIGTVVSTQKHQNIEGAKLLLVQPLTLDGASKGVAVLAIDSVGAGIGETVLVVIEGKAAGDALRRKAAPVDAAIIGIIDAITVDSTREQ